MHRGLLGYTWCWPVPDIPEQQLLVDNHLGAVHGVPAVEYGLQRRVEHIRVEICGQLVHIAMRQRWARNGPSVRQTITSSCRGGEWRSRSKQCDTGQAAGRWAYIFRSTPFLVLTRRPGSSLRGTAAFAEAPNPARLSLKRSFSRCSAMASSATEDIWAISFLAISAASWDRSSVTSTSARPASRRHCPRVKRNSVATKTY